MLNSGLISWFLKRQPTVVLSSTETKYITLTLATKKATWLRLLLTELDFLQFYQQHAIIKVSEGNTYAQAIQQDSVIAHGGESESGVSDGVNDIVILLKGNNQGSIALAYNLVFYSRTKHIDIQYHYIPDEVAS